MANLALSFEGTVSTFGISSVDRSDIYGKRRRVALDSDGNICTRVSVTEDGSTVLKSGMTGQGYFLPNGQFVKQSAVEVYSESGKRLSKQASSLSEPQPLQGPVEPERILDTHITSVYMLEPTEVSETLRTSLDGGAIYELSFCYRDSYTPEQAFIVSNKNGYFMLSGEAATTEWVSLETSVAIPVADEIDDDDLDFDNL